MQLKAKRGSRAGPMGRAATRPRGDDHANLCVCVLAGVGADNEHGMCGFVGQREGFHQSLAPNPSVSVSAATCFNGRSSDKETLYFL